MSYKKFKPNDIILNTMKTHPTCEFFITDGRVFYNNIPDRSASHGYSLEPNTAWSSFALAHHDANPFDSIAASARWSVPITGGFISLYEYNVDRPQYNTGKYVPPNTSPGGDVLPNFDAENPIPDSGIIYPFITKDGARSSFKTAGKTSYNNEFQYGDILFSHYPMSASITRETLGDPLPESDKARAGSRVTGSNTGPSPETTTLTDSEGNEYPFMEAPRFKHYYALKNRLNFYGLRSVHYKVIGTSSAYPTMPWNKDDQCINLISVPSIFYGTRIKPGTVSLKWYYTGSLIGELRDTKRNGELIQYSGAAASGADYTAHDGKVAGVIMYDEGFVLLTGSWEMGPTDIGLTTSSVDKPKWVYFGAGAQDGLNRDTCTGTTFESASFNMSFRGTTETQVMTMFAHARRGEVNYSNNPTFLQFGQTLMEVTSSKVYEENSSRTILNTVSSSYSDYSASFKRQVYVSRVALYDESKNLIGVATLSNPIRKEEDQDLTFKIRLDI